MNFHLHGYYSGMVAMMPFYLFDVPNFVIGIIFGIGVVFGIIHDVLRYFDERINGAWQFSQLGYDAHNFEGLFNHWFWKWNLPFAMHVWIDWLWHDESGNWKKGTHVIEIFLTILAIIITWLFFFIIRKMI